MNKTILSLLFATAAALHADPMPIDLPSALMLADEQNTDLAIQLQKVERAALEKSDAWYQWVPTLRVGAGYSWQNGALQDTSGNISNIERNSSYAGFGAGAAGSGLPSRPGLSMNLDLAEAFYGPLAAKQQHKAARFEEESVRLKVMLEVAAAYYDLVRATREREVAEGSAINAEKLGKLTADFADSGQGLPADAERAAVESLIQQQKVELAQEHVDGAANSLARLLRLEDNVQLRPADSTITPLALIDADTALPDYISQALENRPEIGQNRAIINAQTARLKQDKYGLFIPKVELGYSYGNFGGGSGNSNSYDDDRSDLYGMIYWQFDSLGLRNSNAIKKRRAQINMAKAQEQQAMTDMVADVRQAYTEFHSAQRQIALVRRAVDSARKSYELNNERIHENMGLPLEALQSMKALAEAESLYLAIATKYNLAQLRLVSATGQGLAAEAE
jgi:outer membrane protein